MVVFKFSFSCVNSKVGDPKEGGRNEIEVQSPGGDEGGGGRHGHGHPLCFWDSHKNPLQTQPEPGTADFWRWRR